MRCNLVVFDGGVVRSTLLWHQPLAAPSGEIGGVTGMCSREPFERIFQHQKIIKSIWSTMVPYTSECVDSESAIDSLISVCLIVFWSHFRSDMVDIGCQKCQDERERAFAYARMIKYNSLSVLKAFMTRRKISYFLC